MEWYTLGAIIFAALFILLATGMPIVFCLGVVAMGTLYFLVGPNMLSVMGKVAFGVTTNFVLIAVPLFFFMGEVIIFSGMGDNGFEAINKTPSGPRVGWRALEDLNPQPSDP